MTSTEGSEVDMSPCVKSDDTLVHLLVENLPGSSSYNFTIISNNSVGEQSTAAVSFCKPLIRLRCQKKINFISTNSIDYILVV